jgi:hypothetical protein
MTNSLQSWLNRIFGRKPKSSPAVPDQRPNTPEEDAAELRSDDLEERIRKRDAGGSDPPDYDV